MLDIGWKTDDLIGMLEDAVPIPAMMSAALVQSLKETHSDLKPMHPCTITEVHYAGDDGGIMCVVQPQGVPESSSVIVSAIAHLEFHPRLWMSREIIQYKKHRLKRMLRKSGCGPAVAAMDFKTA